MISCLQQLEFQGGLKFLNLQQYVFFLKIAMSLISTSRFEVPLNYYAQMLNARIFIFEEYHIEVL